MSQETENTKDVAKGYTTVEPTLAVRLLGPSGTPHKRCCAFEWHAWVKDIFDKQSVHVAIEIGALEVEEATRQNVTIGEQAMAKPMAVLHLRHN